MRVIKGSLFASQQKIKPLDATLKTGDKNYHPASDLLHFFHCFVFDPHYLYIYCFLAEPLAAVTTFCNVSGVFSCIRSQDLIGNKRRRTSKRKQP